MSSHPAQPNRSKAGSDFARLFTPGLESRWLLLPAGVLALHLALLWHWPSRTEPALGAGSPVVVLNIRPEAIGTPAPEPIDKANPTGRKPATAATPGGPSLAASSTPPEADMPAGLALPTPLPPGEGLLRFRLQQDGQDGEAWLQWQASDGRYALELRRRLPSRELPVWRSQGRIGDTGLVPEQFTALRGGRARQRIDFLHDKGQIRHSDLAERQPLPAGVQDRLSWWLQLPALAEAWRARHGSLFGGQHLRLPVALLRGGSPDWVFEVVERDAQGHWLLRRPALGAYDSLLEVWLAPQQGHRLVRLVQHLGEGESWALQLDEPTTPAAVQQTEDKTP